MSDRIAESVVAVDVQGEENINRLRAALDQLQQAGVNVQRAVAAAGPAAATAAAQQHIRNITQQTESEVGQIGIKAAEAFGAAIGGTLRATFDTVKNTAGLAGQALLRFAGPLGDIAGKMGPTGAAVAGLTLAVTGLLAPIAQVVAGFKLLGDSFGYAKDAAEEQLRVAARARRFFPGAVGEGLEAAEEEMRSRMGVMNALFGNAAESMQQQVTRRFTEYRFGRGLRGEADIFERWGITPESLQRMEQAGERMDLTSWLRYFTIKREELQSELGRARESGTPEEQQAIEKRLGMLADDTVKLFGQKFADMAGVMGTSDIDRFVGNLREALPIGHVENATQKAIDFTVSLQSLRATFDELKRGIGGEVMPAITTFLETLNTKLTQVNESGQSVATALRELAGSLATEAWRTLQEVLNRIDVERINTWIAAIRDWQPADTATQIGDLISGVVNFASAIGQLIGAINNLLGMLPDWLRPGAGGNPFAAGLQAAGLSPAGGEGAAGGAQPLPGVNAVRGLFGAAPLGGGGEAAGAPAPAASMPAPATGPGPEQQQPQQPGFFGRLGQRLGLGGGGETAAPAAAAPAPAVAAPAATPAAAAAPPSAAPAPAVAAQGAAPAVSAAPTAPAAGGIPGINAPTVGRPQWGAGMTSAPPAPAPAPATAAPGPPPPPPQQPAQSDLWGGFTQIGRAREGAQAPTQAAPGPPPPPSGAEAAPAYGIPGINAPLVTKPSPGAVEAFKGAAGGAAFGLMTDVESTPQGSVLTMSTTRPDPAERRYVPGSNIEIATPEEQRAAFANRNIELRAMRGTGTLPSDRFGEAMTSLTTPPSMQDRWTGGMTAEDGAAFGAAAGQTIRDQLQGATIPYGPAATSYGVAPRTAPKPTGGDTATEA